MDRSFLTDASVIEASRDFVCIRLATYEDAEEAEFLKQVFTGSSGELENTVFCLLSPDGKEKLSRAGRGPQMAFGRPQQLASAMKRIAEGYEPNASTAAPALPQMKNVRLALNVAECDALPLVVCLAENDQQLQSLQTNLAPLAFSTDLAGRFAYASSQDPAELRMISGKKPHHGYLIVTPGEFGIDGQLQQSIAADAAAGELESALRSFADQYQRPPRDHHQHVRTGQQQGVDWKTEIPVTDPMANRARQQGGPGGRRGPPPGKKR